MTSKISQSFFLQHLIAQLLPAHRDLILEILDPANLAERIPITGGRAIDLAHESELVFCKTESESLVTAVLHSKSQFVIARPQIRPYLPVNFGDRHVLILTDKPRLLMALLLTPFDAASAVSQQKETIHPAARLAPDIILGRGVVIGADVEIGASCIIGPNTVIDHATIGKNTRIGFNCRDLFQLLYCPRLAPRHHPGGQCPSG
jgi:UDP-3-O-[3-hydroxymyristoyl] glucosamine N-acyltransferase